MRICRPRIASLILVAIVLLHPKIAVALGDTVTAASCAVAAGGDANTNTVTCNFGLTDEQLRQVTQAAISGATSPLLDRIKAISNTLGVTTDAARMLLKILGEQDVPDEKLAVELTKIATDYKRLQDQVAALNPSPTAEALVVQANAAIDAGNLARAHELLQQATRAEVTAAQNARKLREQAQAAEDAQSLRAASLTRSEGEVALTERNYKGAADLFSRAVEFIPSGHPNETKVYLGRQADALFRDGDERGHNDALRTSIEVWRRVLEMTPRDRVPLDWAQAQHNLGNALEALGEQESGTKDLEVAVAAYRAALEERSRDRVPLDWAQTQNNLGNALEALGERENGTVRLQAAVAAYRAALEQYTTDRAPFQRAMTQSNLGNALEALGEREGGTTVLEEAVTVYRTALQETTRERAPLTWATVENNLGNALKALGERKSGTQDLEAAVVAYEAALQELTQDQRPLDWAQTQNNLGNVLEALGERESGTERLTAALAAWNACLSVASSAWPPDWVQDVHAHVDRVQAELGKKAAK